MFLILISSDFLGFRGIYNTQNQAPLCVDLYIGPIKITWSVFYDTMNKLFTYLTSIGIEVCFQFASKAILTYLSSLDLTVPATKYKNRNIKCNFNFILLYDKSKLFIVKQTNRLFHSPQTLRLQVLNHKI